MAPVNLDYQVPWTPQFALNGRRRVARRQMPSSARPTPVSDTRAKCDEAVAVHPNLPAVNVSGLPSNNPPRISPDPDLSLRVTGRQDGRPSIDLDVSESDNTLPSLEQLIESSDKDQPRGKSSPEAIEVLPAGDWTCEDKGFCLLASSPEQTCDGGGDVNAKCLTSFTNGRYHVSPTALPTTPPVSHTSLESSVSHDHGCTLCPIDPLLTTCHRGKTDTPTEEPGACGSRQSIRSLKAFGSELHGGELDGAASDLSLATVAEEELCQIDIETRGQHSSGGEWPGSNLPYFGTSGLQHGSTIRSGDAPYIVSSGQTPGHGHRGTEEHEDAMKPRRKRRGVEPPTKTLPSPPASTSTENDPDYVAKVAEFEEWALENVLLKRIMVDRVATFQLQFDWNLCTTHCGVNPKTTKRVQRGANRSAPQRRNSGVQRKFTSGEDDLIIRLKEELQLSWTEIHRRHIERYPGRSKGSLQPCGQHHRRVPSPARHLIDSARSIQRLPGLLLNSPEDLILCRQLRWVAGQPCLASRPRLLSEGNVAKIYVHLGSND